MTEEKQFQPGTRVVFKFGYEINQPGTIIHFDNESKKYTIDSDHFGIQCCEEQFVKFLIPKKTQKLKNRVRRAYSIWIVGMILSLSGIFIGQFIGDYYQNEKVFDVVSGLWAFILGGTSAGLGFYILFDFDK